MFILLVTWFTYNAPPQSYQTTFNSSGTCEAASKQLQAQAKQLKAASDADVASRAQRGQLYNPFPTPTVTAVCVRR